MPFSFILSVSWMTHWLKRRPVNCLIFFRRTEESWMRQEEQLEKQKTLNAMYINREKRNKERAGEAEK